jgi:hypothetical protein
MSPTRPRYKESGLELIETLKIASLAPMDSHGNKKKDEGVGDPIKLLLKESLALKRDQMMDNFSKILQQLPKTSGASTSSNNFGGATPFKVQVNFDIPIFERQIDVDALDKWLNMLKGYFSVYDFSDRENITFSLLKVVPHVKDLCETYYEKTSTDKYEMFGTEPS